MPRPGIKSAPLVYTDNTKQLSYTARAAHIYVLRATHKVEFLFYGNNIVLKGNVYNICIYFKANTHVTPAAPAREAQCASPVRPPPGPTQHPQCIQLSCPPPPHLLQDVTVPLLYLFMTLIFLKSTSHFLCRMFLSFGLSEVS